jgi:hypothetical protein
MMSSRALHCTASPRHLHCLSASAWPFHGLFTVPHCLSMVLSWPLRGLHGLFTALRLFTRSLLTASALPPHCLFMLHLVEFRLRFNYRWWRTRHGGGSGGAEQAQASPLLRGHVHHRSLPVPTREVLSVVRSAETRLSMAGRGPHASYDNAICDGARVLH